jgi:hypothetical protein
MRNKPKAWQSRRWNGATMHGVVKLWLMQRPAVSAATIGPNLLQSSDLVALTDLGLYSIWTNRARVYLDHICVLQNCSRM